MPTTWARNLEIKGKDDEPRRHYRREIGRLVAMTFNLVPKDR
jgi:hypothetical protein